MFFEGPNLPIKLQRHSCVTHGSDLIIIGGTSWKETTNQWIEYYSSSLFKLKYQNGSFEWSEMKVHPKLPRGDFVAALIPA